MKGKGREDPFNRTLKGSFETVQPNHKIFCEKISFFYFLLTKRTYFLSFYFESYRMILFTSDQGIQWGIGMSQNHPPWRGYGAREGRELPLADLFTDVFHQISAKRKKEIFILKIQSLDKKFFQKVFWSYFDHKE